MSGYSIPSTDALRVVLFVPMGSYASNLHRDSFGYWYDDDSGDVSYDLFIQPEQLYFRYPEVVPKVNWLRVIIPKDCEHCLCRRDVVFYISIGGRTCSTLPEGAVFEQWF